MRRRGFSEAVTFKILIGSSAIKSVVRSEVIISVCEGIDSGVEFLDSVREIIGGIELIAPGGLHAFNPSVELGEAGRQHPQGDVSLLAGGFELSPELGAAVDLEGPGRGRGR